MGQLSKHASNQLVKQMVRRITSPLLNTREVSCRLEHDSVSSNPVEFLSHSSVGRVRTGRDRSTIELGVFLIRSTDPFAVRVLWCCFVCSVRSRLNNLSLFEHTARYRLSQTVCASLKLRAPVRQPVRIVPAE